jgi:hypothetical protein
MGEKDYGIITTPTELAEHIQADLRRTGRSSDGYPLNMSEFHVDEWKIIVDALKAM